MNCKNCGHPDWCHVKKICEYGLYGNTKTIRDMYMGIPRYVVESEIIGGCNCTQFRS